jgi:hypothetical protein
MPMAVVFNLGTTESKQRVAEGEMKGKKLSGREGEKKKNCEEECDCVANSMESLLSMYEQNLKLGEMYFAETNDNLFFCKRISKKQQSVGGAKVFRRLKTTGLDSTKLTKENKKPLQKYEFCNNFFFFF